MDYILGVFKKLIEKTDHSNPTYTEVGCRDLRIWFFYFYSPDLEATKRLLRGNSLPIWRLLRGNSLTPDLEASKREFTPDLEASKKEFTPNLEASKKEFRKLLSDNESTFSSYKFS